VENIFEDEVEVTEKVDGSQFVFGKIDGKMFYRSKGKAQEAVSPDKMFACGIEYIESVQNDVPEGMAFYCELLAKPKHNTLAYERVPKNNLVLFGISEQHGSRFCSSTDDLPAWADRMGIESVPVLYRGKISNPDMLLELLEKDSFLGKCKIEGVVVKNYYKQFLLGGQPMPLMAGKFVSEAFKEVHRNTWKQEHTGPGKWELFMQGYRTEARWAKAVQHLADKGVLENDPRDIGKLMMEVKADIVEEEQVEIKEFLWREFGSQLLRKSTAGLPEWYKESLLKNSFKEKDNE
jgi:hypothetical protein